MRTKHSLDTLEREYHPLKNEIPFEDVKQKDTVWWLGECGHTWLARLGNRLNGSKCVYCSNQKVLVGFNDLATTHPHVAAEWHPTFNGGFTAEQVTKGSERKVWWLGKNCGHEWEAVVYSRSNKSAGCPYCSNQKVLAGFNDLYSLDFELAKEFSLSRNFPLTAHEVLEYSNKLFWWQCDKGHEWRTSVNKRKTGGGCVYCSNQKVLVGFNDLATTHPHVAAEWHPTLNDGLSVMEVVAGSAKKVWWVGKDCGHVWEASVNGRAGGRGCPYCSGNKVLAGFNDLEFLFPGLVSEWHPTLNGGLLPNQVVSKSSLKVWWQCSKGHSWDAIVSNRTDKQSGCPDCFGSGSKMEEDLAVWLTSVIKEGMTVVRKNRSVIKPLELDFYIPEKNVAIEFNGLYWHSENAGKAKNYHRDKWLACKEQGIQLIQVWEDDWRNNRPLIERMLLHKLGISNDVKIFARKLVAVELFSTESKLFLDVNHLQGYRAAKYFGLKTSEDVLVAVLGVQRKGDLGIEIIRFASSIQVPGGFSKLLSFVLRKPEYAHVKEIFSYSLNDHATGGLYEQNGFSLVHTGTPGYSYLKPGNGDRIHRLFFSPSAIKKSLDFEYVEGASERELAELNSLNRVWDSGSSLWMKRV